ncbi:MULTISPECIES: hypothetical protein [Micrococcus]|uniref:hypothetical protein n=1 Tax=Micrococcus TaxID=1269 RepID=UPI0007AB6546|nr:MULTISPECIES: hypothetical protein [Micrococcus]MCV7471431.1 hypothetical protein [Micrococcus luteus]KZE70558.1 hypothetical protein AWM60_05535 [Micrococcus aloeverae]MBM4623550.1 hypothetical protein [Micrococcus sp. JV4]MCV7486770.1 hypothetical protein [Micrococcus luteus]MCV7600303.1 hypothetical protein [Micrococcus luteus]
MPQSTLYWIIAAIIVVLLILIILSVIASRRRREAEAEAAETRLERRGVSADTAGEQAAAAAAAPAAPTRLSRLDEVAAEKDARPAAAVKPAGGPAASDTAAADRETDESVAGVAGGAGVTVDQQDAPSTEATAETPRRDAAAPATRRTLRPAAAAPSTAREADTVGLGAAGVAGGSGVTLDEQTPAADVPATPASPSPVAETPAPAAPAAAAPDHRSHLTPAPEHVPGTVPADQVAAEHTPTKEFATDAIPAPQGEHLETHTVATTAHGSVTVVATESDQSEQNGADGTERSAAGSLRVDGTPGVPGRVAEADRESARTDDHRADAAQPAAVESAAERPSLEAAPATRRAETPETHAGTTPATPLGGTPELDPTAASSGRAEDATPATRREARAAQSAAAAGTAGTAETTAPTSSTPSTVAPDTSTSSAPTDEEPAEDDTEGAALPDLRADRDETRGSDAEGESKLAQAGAVAASAFETVRDKVAIPLRDNVAVPAKDKAVKVVKDKLAQAQERRWGKR